MNYYAVERSEDHLRHYGIKGMRWGVRRALDRGDQRALSKHYQKAQKKLIKRIDRNSDSKYGTWSSNYSDHSQGFFNAPNAGEKSNRYKLWETMTSEFSKDMNGHGSDGSSKADKSWKRISKKYQRAYLEAVLKDAKIPINRKNMETAHKYIAKKDSEYARYNSKFKY